ncbi:MAG: AAA domain-containing protein [Bacteroidota bacterium]
MNLNIFQYFYEILKHARRGQQLFLNIRDTAKHFIDLSGEFHDESLISGQLDSLIVKKPQEKIDITNHESTQDNDSFFGTNEPQPEKVVRAESSVFIKLLRLYDNYLNNPYEFEILYNYLFVVGNTEEGKEVFAPIITIPAKIEYSNQGLKITLAEDNVRLNSFALTQLYPETANQRFDEFVSLEDSGLPFSINRINEILEKITNIHPAIVPCRLSGISFDNTTPSKLERCKFQIYNSAGIALPKKDNVYIIENLKQLAQLSLDHFSETALKTLLETTELSEEGEVKSPIRKQLLFPFANNTRQCQVVHKANLTDLVVVQGPPGTGKSQTITNVICDLVANGHSVLVSSQKNKALEVVSEKLDTLNIPYLHTTLLKDDKTSKKHLKDAVDSITADIHSGDAEQFFRQWEHSNDILSKIDDQIAKLKCEFNSSCAFEKIKIDKFQTTIGELSKRFVSIQCWNLLDKTQTIEPNEQVSLIEQTGIYFNLLSSIDQYFKQFVDLDHNNKLPQSVEDIYLFQDEIHLFLSHFENELSQLSRQDRQSLLAQLGCSSILSTQEAQLRLQKIEEIHPKIESYVQSHIDNCTNQVQLTLFNKLKEANANSDTILTDCNHLREIKQKAKELFSLAEKALQVRLGELTVDQIKSALLSYESRHTSWFRWLSPDFYKSRKVLCIALQTSISSIDKKALNIIEAFLESMEIYATIQSKLKSNLEYLGLPQIACDSQIESRFLFTSEIQKRIQLLEHYVDRLNIETTLVKVFNNYVTFENLENFSKNDLGERIKKACIALNSHIHKKEAVAIISSLSDRFSGSLIKKVSDFFNKTELNDCKDYVEHINELFTKLPTFLTLQSIDISFSRNSRAILSILRELYFQNKSRFQEYYSNLSTILEARYLCTEIDLMENSFPRPSHVISKEIQALELQRFEDVKRTIKIGIKANLSQKLATRKHSQNLKYFAKVLQKGKKNFASFEELKSSIDYDSIITALPCWIMSVEDVARIFPLKPGLFDYVIIDESSQCAIPSAIPLLYRAKKAIIVGDDKQLPNADVRFIDGNRNESLLREYKIPQIRFGRSFDCKDNSLFDLCNVLAPSSVFLNEHFRSYPEIIRFSNEQFYNRKLLMARSSFGNQLGPILNLVQVPDAVDSPDSQVNHQEADALIAKLIELLKKPEYREKSFGILSIFREQVEYLKEVAFDRIDAATREKIRLIVETADGFQGDERDVILYSFRYASNSSPRLFTFMSTKDGEKRLNVALTRARNQVYCFVSVPPNEFPQIQIKNFLRYVQDPSTLKPETEPWDSEFEKEVHSLLENYGLTVFPQYKSCGFKIDLVATDQNGKVLAIECDGWEFHYDEWGQLFESDIERQSILERAGWRVERICSRDFYRNKERALKPIVQYFFE